MISPKINKRDERLTPMSLRIYILLFRLAYLAVNKTDSKSEKTMYIKTFLSTTKSFEYFPNGLLPLNSGFIRILLGYATYQNKKRILIGYAMLLNDSAFVSHAH